MRNILIAVLAMATVACGRIETGNVGVRTDFNKQVETNELNPGFYTSFFTDVDEFVAKEIEIPFDSLTPKGKDNLVLADFDVSVYYKPNSGQVADLVIKYSGMSPRGEQNGFYYPALTLVERVSRGVIFDSVSKYESLTIHTKRAELEQDILKNLQAELDKNDKGAFTITNVIVRSIKTDPALEQSIQAAVQMQKKVEAKLQEVELARAEAERKRVEAEGTAKANSIIANSITDKYLEYKSIEMQGQFAREGTHTVVFGNPAGSLVNIK